jgi:hypothetical protein
MTANGMPLEVDLEPSGVAAGTQMVTTEDQIVIAAEVNVDAPTSGTWSRWSPPPAPSSRTPG